MLGYQTQSQGSTAGLTLFATQNYPYALPVQRLLPAESDSIHWSDASSLRSQELSSWASSLRQYTQDIGVMEKPVRQPMAATTAEPADLSRLVDIEFAAFRDEHINHHLSYRDGTDPSHVRRTLQSYRKYMNNLRSVPPEQGQRAPKASLAPRPRSDSACENSLGFRFRKVESPLGGEIIAFCKSEMTEMTPEELDTPLDAGHEGEPQMNRDWFALNERYHREYCGTRKHCYFGMLATHPDHQHQGAATMLMDELVAEADRLGVEIYCEATSAGRPLYEKYGFVAVKEIEFATADYGLSLGEERQTVMVRGALRDGRRCKVESFEDRVRSL
ncbi:hypothetical protein AMS68_003088 [Peltaster fructicola]|uniref:N-acetyltransferase domain-containing protein n=1 Tax=Peltaster fructicola TaxID=286661 RepID=A0A6H0XSD5_9PEZI|nr:hypothetical protein AMS68_003088 [Peltaster fructicola]